MENPTMSFTILKFRSFEWNVFKEKVKCWNLCDSFSVELGDLI